MSREIITISKMGAVTVPTAPVWMTQFEIADLFDVKEQYRHRLGQNGIPTYRQ